jgi:lipopolysaccharide transport protein LptA
MKILAVLALLATASCCDVKPAKVEPVVRFEAINARFDKKHHQASFVEACKLNDGGITIDSDKMTVFFVPDEAAADNNIERIACEGNIILQQGEQTATAETAEYFYVEGKVILSGNVVLKDKRGVMRAAQMTIFRDAAEVKFRSPRS